MVDATAPTAGSVTWVVYRTQSDLVAAYSTSPNKPRADLGPQGSFSVRDRSILDGGGCVIHTVFPGGFATETALGETLAHEFRHCVEGDFHPRQ